MTSIPCEEYFTFILKHLRFKLLGSDGPVCRIGYLPRLKRPKKCLITSVRQFLRAFLPRRRAGWDHWRRRISEAVKSAVRFVPIKLVPEVTFPVTDSIANLPSGLAACAPRGYCRSMLGSQPSRHGLKLFAQSSTWVKQASPIGRSID